MTLGAAALVITLALAGWGCGEKEEPAGDAGNERPAEGEAAHGSEETEAEPSREFLTRRDQPVELSSGDGRYRVRLLASEKNAGNEIRVEKQKGKTYVLMQIGAENLDRSAPAKSLSTQVQFRLFADPSLLGGSCPGDREPVTKTCVLEMTTYQDSAGEPGTNESLPRVGAGDAETFWAVQKVPLSDAVKSGQVRLVMVPSGGARFVTKATSKLERSVGGRDLLAPTAREHAE
jgi:hypothetical protein